MMDPAEEAWRLGREAGLGEVARQANPYAAGSDLAEDWDDGWHEGRRVSNHPAEPVEGWAEAWRLAFSG